MKKKFLAVLLAGALTVGTAQMAFATGAETADGDTADSEPETLMSEDGKWEYYVDEEKGGAVISKHLIEETDVVIPDKIGEYDVVDVDFGVFGTGSVNDSDETIKSISIPNNIKSLTWDTFDALESITVDKDNPNYTSVDGVLFNKEMSNLICYPINKEGEEYTIPDGVIYVYPTGPLMARKLSKLIVSKDVKEFVHWTDTYANYNAEGLKEIVVDEDNQNYSSQDGVLYDHDKTTMIVYPPLKEDTSLVVPESVVYISNFRYGLFRKCKYLTTLTIPKNMELLDLEDATITTINYPGTMAEFNDLMYKMYTTGAAGLAYERNIKIICEDGIINSLPEKADEETPEEPEDKPSSGSSSSSSSGSTTTTTEPTEYTDAENETGVTASADEGVLPDGAELVVTPVTSETSDSEFTYDISFKDTDGKEVQPKGNVTVKVPVPEKFKDAEKIYVYRAETDGTYTDMKAEIKDGLVVFTTNHFSKYIVTTEVLTKTETPAPDTPKPTDTTPADTTTNPNTGVAVALIPVILAGAVVIVSAKKRK